MKKLEYETKRAEVIKQLKQFATTEARYLQVERIAKEVGLIESWNWLRDDAEEELVIASLK